MNEARERPPTPRTVVLGFVLLAVAFACHRPGIAVGLQLPPAADANRITAEVVTRPGQLTWEETAGIGYRVATLRAEPASLLLRVGDTVALASRVRILAIDSAGTVLGELSHYSHGYTGRSLWMHEGGRVRAREAGRVSWRVRFPEALWKGDRTKVPTVVVPLILSETGPTSPAIVP